MLTQWFSTCDDGPLKPVTRLRPTSPQSLLSERALATIVANLVAVTKASRCECRRTTGVVHAVPAGFVACTPKLCPKGLELVEPAASADLCSRVPVARLLKTACFLQACSKAVGSWAHLHLPGRVQGPTFSQALAGANYKVTFPVTRALLWLLFCSKFGFIGFPAQALLKHGSSAGLVIRGDIISP